MYNVTTPPSQPVCGIMKWPYARLPTPSSKMYLLSLNALRHVLLISTVRRTWFLDWKVREVLGVDLNVLRTARNWS